MSTSPPSPSLDARLFTLERRLVLWRRLALGVVALVVLAGVVAFQLPTPRPLEATSLTLHGVRGGTVVLSLRPSGELEARFTQGAGSVAGHAASGALVLVSPQGREIVRLGEPMARPLTPP